MLVTGTGNNDTLVHEVVNVVMIAPSGKSKALSSVESNLPAVSKIAQDGSVIDFLGFTPVDPLLGTKAVISIVKNLSKR